MSVPFLGLVGGRSVPFASLAVLLHGFLFGSILFLVSLAPLGLVPFAGLGRFIVGSHSAGNPKHQSQRHAAAQN